mmetsp:Transcript_6254/g.14830  ORF Transcript_6254/g.14830 Transcript_6254/m.14830 type:complete len:285 (+) Transcript_6254:3-857(+)
MVKKRSLAALALVCACVAVLAVDYASRPMDESELQQQQTPNWVRQSMNGQPVYVGQPVLPPFSGGRARGALRGANQPAAWQATLDATEESAEHAGEGAEEAAVREGEGEQAEVGSEEEAEQAEVAKDENEERMEAQDHADESEREENGEVREGEVADQAEYDAEEGDDAALGEADGEVQEEPEELDDKRARLMGDWSLNEFKHEERPIDSYNWRKVAFGENGGRFGPTEAHGVFHKDQEPRPFWESSEAEKKKLPGVKVESGWLPGMEEMGTAINDPFPQGFQG